MSEKRFFREKRTPLRFSSEKRFFLHKKFLRKDKFHDRICHNFMDSKETEQTLNRLYDKYSSLKMENKQLKQELFEIKKDYLIETYSDNPTRRDEKIQGLKEELKERFGDFE